MKFNFNTFTVPPSWTKNWVTTHRTQTSYTKKCWRRSEHLLWCVVFMPKETKSEPKAQAQLLGSGSAASGPGDVFKTICSGLDIFGNAVTVIVSTITDRHQCIQRIDWSRVADVLKVKRHFSLFCLWTLTQCGPTEISSLHLRYIPWS